MTKKNNLTKKEKLYILLGAGALIIILIISGIIAFNNLLKSDDVKGRIQMSLDDSKVESGEETFLTITVKNTGNSLMEGTLNVYADDKDLIDVSHEDPSVLEMKLYAGESITRILTVTGETSAIRTDYKIIAKLEKDNKEISSNEIILTVTNES